MTRITIIGLACLGWVFVGWLSTQRSDMPAVFGIYSHSWLALMACCGFAALLLTFCCFGRPYRFFHRRRGELLLLAISTMFAIGLAEALVRLIDPLGIAYYAEMKRYRQAQIADDELVYKHPANWSAVLQGVSVSTNEYGFRDRAIEAKRPGELRIVTLGDSIAFGWGVDESQTFTRQLEQILSDALNRPVRNINTAVASYNTEQEYALLRRYYDVLAPDVVILVVVSNDDEIAVRPEAHPTERARIKDRSPAEVLTELRNRLWLYRIIYHLHRYGWYDDQPDPGWEGWRRALAAYRSFGEFCEQRQLVCVTFYHRMYTSPKNEVFVCAYAEVADRHGWPFYDTRSWFPVQNDTRSLINSVVDTHPSPKGHRLIAEHQAKVLIDVLQHGQGAHSANR